MDLWRKRAEGNWWALRYMRMQMQTVTNETISPPADWHKYPSAECDTLPSSDLLLTFHFSVTTHRNLRILYRHFLSPPFSLSHTYLLLYNTNTPSFLPSFSLFSSSHSDQASPHLRVHGGRRVPLWIASLSQEQNQILSLLIVLLPSPPREAEDRSEFLASKQVPLHYHRFPAPDEGEVLQLHLPDRPPPPPPLRRLPLRRAQLRLELRWRREWREAHRWPQEFLGEVAGVAAAAFRHNGCSLLVDLKM